MKLISCVFYKGYYYIIGYWVAEIIRSICNQTLNNNKPFSIDNSKEDFALEEELFNLILLNIADLLQGFLVLYTNMIMKPFTKKEETTYQKEMKNLKLLLIYNNISYRNNHELLLILLMSILDFLASSVYFFSTIPKIQRLKPRQIDWMLSIDIIARIFFSILILKIKVRNHHILSILLCMIGFLLMGFSDILSIIKGPIETKDVIIFIMIIFPKAILFPLVDVLNKIVLFNEFYLPHSLIFWRGVTQFTFFLFILPILYFNDKINFEYFTRFNASKIIYSILFTFISSIRGLCQMNVIYIFNPQYVSFLLVIIIFEYTIQQFFVDDNIYNFEEIKGKLYFTIDILALIIISFGTLLFNEMIIINACGLNEKTKKGLLSTEKIDGIENMDSFYYTEEDEENTKEKSNNKNIRSTPIKTPSSYSYDNADNYKYNININSFDVNKDESF